MVIALAGGVEVDLATRDDLLGVHQRLERLRPPHGRYYTISGEGLTSSTFSGSGPIAISFTPQSPPSGRIWAVQWAACWPATNPSVGAIANLFATLCAGRCPTGPGAPPANTAIVHNLGDTLVPGQAVPSSINVPDKTIITSRLQFYVLFGGSGLAASTQYNATAGVIDLPDTDESILW